MQEEVRIFFMNTSCKNEMVSIQVSLLSIEALFLAYAFEYHYTDDLYQLISLDPLFGLQ